MPGVRVDNSPAVARKNCDIASWKEGDTSSLGAGENERYNQRKSAIKDYLTTDASLDEIALRHHISSETLWNLLEKCFMLHEDGTPWGFRALLPGVEVVDHTPLTPAAEEALPATEEETLLDASTTEGPAQLSSHDDEDEDTGKREAITRERSSLPANEAVPETPVPDFSQSEERETAVEETPAWTEGAELTTDESPAAVAEGELAPEDALSVPESEEATLPGEEEEVPTEPGTGEEPVLAQPGVTSVEKPAASSEEGIPAQPGEAVAEASAPPLEETAQEFYSDIDDEETAQEFYADSDERLPVVVDEMSPVGSEIANDEARIAILPDMGAEVVDAATWSTAVLPLYNSGRYKIVDKKTAQLHRVVRKRKGREEDRSRRRRVSAIMGLAVLAALLIGLLMPLGAGLATYNAYTNVRGLATDGVNHLLKVKSLLSISKSDPLAALDAPKLQQSQTEFRLAQDDFTQLEQLVNRPDIAGAIQQFAPEYSSKLDMARSLVQVGMDVSRMGDEMIGIALLGTTLVHGSPLATGNTDKPLITPADIAAVEGSMVHALYYISDIRFQMSRVSLKDLPVSAKQRGELASVMTLLPTAQSVIEQVQGMTGLVSWLLGVGQQRRFLVQTMDRGEIRPGGGFTGQYGVLQLSNGRMAPFGLHDVVELDYAGNLYGYGRPTPALYKSWMNFGNWGLRDSNLSADFPTNAQTAMQIFQDEGGGPVDGDIAFTPTFISHILNTTGPIRVAEYNDTITSKNLEDKLHYYQQNATAIAIQTQHTHSTKKDVRKAFTFLVGKLLLERVRHLSVKQLISLAKGAVKDIQSRDLEIYFANPVAEDWLVKHGLSGATSTYAQQDGFMVVQANISISKASQYVHTTLHDNVTLDTQGGARHDLTITLDYQQTGPVYGFDTYADYIRVYGPPGARFLSGDGFDTGHALCQPSSTKKPGNTANPANGGTGTVGCGQYNSNPPGSTRYCPSGNYSLGDRYKGVPWPIDSLGAPTQLHSDLPGRSMWGGMTETPKNCTSTFSVSWYVPHEVKKGDPNPYTLLVQKQGGYVPTLQLSIDTSALHLAGFPKIYKYNGNLNADTPFTLRGPVAPPALQIP